MTQAVADMSRGMQFQRAAPVALACAALAAAMLGRGWIALALLVAALGYGYDLLRQRDPGALQPPLKRVGQRALALSSVFSGLLILEFR